MRTKQQTMEQQTMEQFITFVKTTIFYHQFIEKLYICDETPEILWATFKCPYTKRDEITFWQDTKNFDFVLNDAEYAYAETEQGIHHYILQEVNI